MSHTQNQLYFWEVVENASLNGTISIKNYLEHHFHIKTKYIKLHFVGKCTLPNIVEKNSEIFTLCMDLVVGFFVAH